MESGIIGDVKTAILVAFAVAGAICAQCQDTRPPRFEDYPVEAIALAETASPNLSRTADADSRFRDVLDDALRKGVNFAGHLAIIRWSCGAGCSNSVVVDTITGVVYRRTPFYSLLVGYDVGRGSSEYSGLLFHPNSRLVVAEGCFGEHARCARRYYLWAGKRFKLLNSIPVPTQ
jgi:hypothetical protein